VSNQYSAMSNVQKGIFTTLEADATLMAAVNNNLFDEVPDNYGNFPYIQLGEINETPENVMGSNGQGRICEQTIHIYSQAKGWQEAQNLLNYLVQDIDIGVANVKANTAGWNVYMTLYTFGREIRDPDGTRHIVAKFQIHVGQQ